ncbi:helix-turn-helix transcriptional regulator [Clostridium sp. AWRP]|uniref:helix-turn-helix domain-containing protein n=1 Tax=Clostridium sp. AWRP TaxID=2212991 RepID=UPI000FD8C85B|nr:helix-turn-helix transcriptional regulator [Clostridium sp. AWRP]AZV56032.1 helix-turn-helix domain-containing protein [Clostridium sp. AWRP]
MNKEVLAKIGKKLKEARNNIGLTQEEVAKAVNLNKGQISYYENATREITITALEKLANLYGYKLDYFLSNEDTTESQISIAFRADEVCGDDIKIVAFAEKFLNNLLDMKQLQGK